MSLEFTKALGVVSQAFGEQNAIYNTEHFQSHSKILFIIIIKNTSHTKQWKDRILKFWDTQVPKCLAAVLK